jgi:hypothetical protein
MQVLQYGFAVESIDIAVCQHCQTTLAQQRAYKVTEPGKNAAPDKYIIAS